MSATTAELKGKKASECSEVELKALIIDNMDLIAALEAEIRNIRSVLAARAKQVAPMASGSKKPPTVNRSQRHSKKPVK